MAQPILYGEALRQLVLGALAVFPNSTLDRQHTAGPNSAEPGTVRRAVDYIDAHAGEQTTLTEIADAARIGPRALQLAFRKHRNQPPLAYLRRVRLERAHRDLQAGDPTRGDTVVAIAARWGFAHPGRFAGEYRHFYGRPPSETLRS
ncbi:helix-turn-helix transcriptional regulator [Actinomycetospora sp. TBRC 11914]|nr:helix-turn-helix transcriptional regulator [Actinomycetospora sp. TBRC 11914]